MRCVIVLSGRIADDAAVLDWLRQADYIVCADGGARHLHRLGIIPQLLLGDLDSITETDYAWLKENQVPLRRFPVAKDETDSELALLTLIAQLPQPPEQHQITLVGALGSRPDHVLANQLLAASLAGQGWKILLTDGESQIYSLAGGQTLSLMLPSFEQKPLAVSLLSLSDEVRGLNAEGLKYPLSRATLRRGSTLGISNQVAGKKTEGEKPSVRIDLEQGRMLVIITPFI